MPIYLAKTNVTNHLTRVSVRTAQFIGNEVRHRHKWLTKTLVSTLVLATRVEITHVFQKTTKNCLVLFWAPFEINGLGLIVHYQDVPRSPSFPESVPRT